MKKTVLFILCLLFGLMFINAGLDKFFHYMPVPEDIPEEAIKDFTAMMEVAWLMPLIACIEILGGILFIIPKTRALGALVILPVMAGILLTNIMVAPAGLLIVFVLIAVLGWAIYENRGKYAYILK